MEIPKPDDLPPPDEKKSETDDEQQARESEQAFERALNRIPAG
jgi:hypothetical protein